MGHQIKNDIDPKRESPLLGKFMKKIVEFPFALPAVAVVRVVGGNNHDVAPLIENRAHMDFGASLAVMILPGDTRLFAVLSRPEVRSLQLVFRDIEVKNTMEDRVLHWQLDKF